MCISILERTSVQAFFKLKTGNGKKGKAFTLQEMHGVSTSTAGFVNRSDQVLVVLVTCSSKRV